MKITQVRKSCKVHMETLIPKTVQDCGCCRFRHPVPAHGMTAERKTAVFICNQYTIALGNGSIALETPR
jgi:hypothetical protein